MGYNNDSPSFRVYDRETRRITSSRNVTSIKEPQVLLPAADESGDPDFDVEAEPPSPDEDIIIKGILLLEEMDTTILDTGSSVTNCSSSSAAQDPRAGEINSRLRSSVNKDLPQPDSTNPNQDRPLHQLNLATIASTQAPLHRVHRGRQHRQCSTAGRNRSAQHVQASHGLTSRNPMAGSHAQGARQPQRS